ncbi:hypothetical protein A3A59_02865 [Candidatus Gottesmanbacteria bacterium RIFCSPLOWO2_01_FULL_42_10]|nr:MAG: hypothetical protein A2699_04120 [Candidatus Gottesmanbacteria bacterium RIFCSPHIGHO2_01_FULL_43_15]OGG25321.1 MAG: hypothetical protein A3A59_02865 [Candidatus Gottesmanbacteria bacterium RIFCSPLOWO2_01_FULL_42_10]
MYSICTMLDLSKIVGFEWDKGNIDKNYEKHGITLKEAEEVFLDEKVFFTENIKHSQKEKRFIVIGRTSQEKIIFTAFTVRTNKIRIISARPVNKKEREAYAKKI